MYIHVIKLKVPLKKCPKFHLSIKIDLIGKIKPTPSEA
jgi:hypothetical protein